jgi:hypothetical protein
MSSEQGFNRRKFIASGVALGGSVLWAPSFAEAARGASIAGRIKSLRDDVAGNNIRDERLLKSMLQKLDRATEAAKDGDDDLVCALLKKFIQITDKNTPTDNNGLTVGEEHAFKREARDIRRDVGCGDSSTGPTGPTGSTGPTGPTGSTGPTGPTGSTGPVERV